MNKKNKIIIFSTKISSFVADDFEYLKINDFKVEVFVFNQSKNFKILLEFLKQFLFLLKLFRSRRNHIYLIWLGDYHSFLPILFSKIYGNKSLLILGGSDVENIPAYKYGVFYKQPRRAIVKFCIQKCTHLLPVDQSLIDRLEINFPSFKNSSTVVPTGYDPNFWKCINEKENIILCVAFINDIQNYYIKGMDRIIELAREMPDYKFKIIGVLRADLFPKNLCQNVEILKPMNKHELIQEYSVAKIFLLLSRSEGLPNVICEAMLCECYPIASNVGGNKNLVNNYGHVFNEFNSLLIKEKINDFIKCNNNFEGRNHIINNYSKNDRYQILSNFFE